MADVNDVFLKVGIDTSQFDGSMKSMQKELKALKGLLGNNLISAAEQKAVLSRMTDLKDELADINAGIGNVDGLQILARTIAGVSAGFGALTGALKLMGVEWEGAQKAQEIMMTTMNISLGIQQLLELQQLKGAIATKTAAAAQWLWNIAMNANPVGLFVVALTALVGAISAVIYIMKDDTSEQIKNNKSRLDAELANRKAMESLREYTFAYEESVRRRKVASGEMRQYESDIVEVENRRYKEQEKLLTEHVGNLASIEL